MTLPANSSYRADDAALRGPYGFLAVEPTLLPVRKNSARRLDASTASTTPAAAVLVTDTENGPTVEHVAEGPLSIVRVSGLISFDDAGWFDSVALVSDICKALRAAADDSQTKAIVLDVHSPGGTTAGGSDLEAAVRHALSRKPVHAIAHDHICSEAYLLCSLANEIVGTQTSVVGSIGTLWGPFFDPTRHNQEEGVEVITIRSGELKGVGMPGVAFSDPIRRNIAAVVEAQYGHFCDLVTEGRKISKAQIDALQGGVFGAAAALSHRLIDRVVPSASAYLDELSRRYAGADPNTGAASVAGPAGSGARGPRSSMPLAHAPTPALTQKESIMIDWKNVTDEDLKGMPPELLDKVKAMYPAKEDEPSTPKAAAALSPATAAELKAAFPNASADFRLAALEAGLTMPQAKDKYLETLQAANSSLEGQLKTLQAKGNQPSVADRLRADIGTVPGGAGAVQNTGGSDPETYEAAITSLLASNPGKPRMWAVAEANKRYPGLRKARFASGAKA